MAAVEPLVELFLEMGVTSPEAESLLRSLFVHKARTWLARRNSALGEPSDARVSLVTGVHRNFVRHILAKSPRISEARQRKGNRSSRILEAWHTDPVYLDDSGKPRDLPERGNSPSFQSLATTYLPGTAPGVLLEELKRAGLIQISSADRLRVRGKSFRTHGLNLASLSDVGSLTRDLLETLTYNLRSPDARRFLESMRVFEVDEQRVAAVREIVSRRAATFLARMEHEVVAAFKTSEGGKTKRMVKIGLTIFATER